MRQVTQRSRDGQIAVHDVPEPTLRPGFVLVRNRYSVISAGTERSKVEVGEKNLLQKARARPDLVKKVVDRARVEGVASAVGAARERLAALSPLGYSSAGTVVRVGAGADGLAPGDRVACAGGGWANHAELVAVPRNLVARVPDGVDLVDAAYATVGAIALHGFRQSEATVGDSVGIVGLGLVGQLAARIALAAGCRTIGIDLDPAAVELAAAAGAHAFGREDHGLGSAVRELTHGRGLDAVLITAASSSSDPVRLAVELARDRGRVVVVGDVPIEGDRAAFYEKELELRLSRSYGPGRYDREYEEGGRDLPAGYVRWTEGRNLEAFVELVAAGRLQPSELTTHRFPVERAADAYAALTGAEGGRAFGVLLDYGEQDGARPSRALPRRAPAAERAGIGLIGAGAFARGTILPALAAAGGRLVTVASEGGLSAHDVASRFGFERGAGSADEVLADGDVGAVVIATRHASHARLAAAALRAGKAVFVEKPLALTYEELDDVESALEAGAPLMVGFNRRFAPLTRRLRAELGSVSDLVVTARVNAGPLPPEHWLHDPADGGGRLLGEGCHFVDLVSHLAGAPPTRVHAFAVAQPERGLDGSDSLVLTLRFRGAVASVVYSGGGDPRLAKERLEAFGGGVSAVLSDFRRLDVYAGGKRTTVKERQDKGHAAQFARFVAVAQGRAEPVPAETYLASTRATLALVESLRTGMPVDAE